MDMSLNYQFFYRMQNRVTTSKTFVIQREKYENGVI